VVDVKHVQIVSPTWFNYRPLAVDEVVELYDDGTAEAWERIGVAVPITEPVYKAAQEQAQARSREAEAERRRAQGEPAPATQEERERQAAEQRHREGPRTPAPLTEGRAPEKK
jgi:hypothetical protein